MAAGIHFVNKFTKRRISPKKKKLRIYLKWPEIRSKVNSKVNFGHPKWVPAAVAPLNVKLVLNVKSAAKC